MTLFTNDLYRNLGIGFVIGTLAAAFSNPDIAQSVNALVA